MSIDWYEWYCQQASKGGLAMYRDRYLCPCCFMPTLEERAMHDICPICSWQDDGQDCHNAANVSGGANHGYSLKEARSNFRKSHTMYRESDVPHFSRELRVMDYKMQMHAAFCAAIKSGNDADWERAFTAMEEYGE